MYVHRGALSDSGPDLFENCVHARASIRRFPRAGPVIGARYGVRRFRARGVPRLAGYTAPNLRRTSGPHLAPYPLSRFSRLLLLISSRLAAACLVL